MGKFDEDPALNPTQIVLYRSGLNGLSFDYLDTVEVDEVSQSGPRRSFTGGVVSAASGATSLILKCLSGLELKDKTAGPAEYDKCPVDLVYSILRGSRGEEDGAGISGFDSLPHEVFDVVAPVTGLLVESNRVALGDLAFVGRDVAVELAQRTSLPMSGATGRAFLESADTFAIARVPSFTMHDAQEEALRQVDDALTLLTTISRFSHSTLPTGTTPLYSRQSTVFQCSRASLVLVRGRSTGRAWLRRAFDPNKKVNLALGKPPLSYLDEAGASYPPSGATALRMLVRFTARAAEMTAPAERVVTLWQALEFYAANTHVTDLFDTKDRRAIKYVLRAVRKKLSSQQNERLSEAIKFLNTPSLLTRLREQLHMDEVPISPEEMGLLKDLRERRNEIIHGRELQSIRDADVDKGVAIAARIAMYSLTTRHRQGRASAG